VICRQCRKLSFAVELTKAFRFDVTFPGNQLDKIAESIDTPYFQHDAIAMEDFKEGELRNVLLLGGVVDAQNMDVFHAMTVNVKAAAMDGELHGTFEFNLDCCILSQSTFPYVELVLKQHSMTSIELRERLVEAADKYPGVPKEVVKMMSEMLLYKYTFPEMWIKEVYAYMPNRSEFSMRIPTYSTKHQLLYKIIDTFAADANVAGCRFDPLWIESMKTAVTVVRSLAAQYLKAVIDCDVVHFFDLYKEVVERDFIPMAREVDENDLIRHYEGRGEWPDARWFLGTCKAVVRAYENLEVHAKTLRHLPVFPLLQSYHEDEYDYYKSFILDLQQQHEKRAKDYIERMTHAVMQEEEEEVDVDDDDDDDAETDTEERMNLNSTDDEDEDEVEPPAGFHDIHRRTRSMVPN